MRLVDVDKIYPDVRTQRGALAISQGQLAYAPTVEAIPKAEYESRLSYEYEKGYKDGYKDGDSIQRENCEARLKADLEAMLTELKKEMKEEIWETSHLHYDELENAEHWNNGINSRVDIIQQKIDQKKEVGK